MLVAALLVEVALLTGNGMMVSVMILVVVVLILVDDMAATVGEDIGMNAVKPGWFSG